MNFIHGADIVIALIVRNAELRSFIFSGAFPLVSDGLQIVPVFVEFTDQAAASVRR